MQRSFFAYGIAAFAIAFACTVAPVSAEEQTTSGTQQAVGMQGAAQDQWMQKFMEQYRAFTAKKQGMGSTTQARVASSTRAQGAPRTLGMHFWNASTSASTTACVQEAVDTRESALGTAWTTYNTAVTAALLARHEALFDAWEISAAADRNTALKSAWKTWGTANKEAHKTFKTARNTAWKTYRTTMVGTCKTIVPREESLASDSVGSVSI